MTEKIKEILRLHKLWLDGDTQGRHADLRYADLRDADLHGADLRHANLHDADLHGADLHGADLHYANLRHANLDYSCLPLWCGGLGLNIDDRLAIQILYHLVSNVIDSTNTSAELKALLSSSTIITAANQFHRVNECGLLDACRQEDKNKTQNLSD